MYEASYKEYHKKGFTNLGVVLSADEVKYLRLAFDRIVLSGEKKSSNKPDPNIDDAPFLDDAFYEILKWEKIKNICKIFLPYQRGVELQHMKINSKSKQHQKGGIKEVKIHQDYPFFPHTNFDLMAITISLDKLSSETGCLEYFPVKDFNSSELLTHLKNKEFLGTAKLNKHRISQGEMIIGDPGTISLHSCLTPHRSKPNKSNFKRRLIIIQVRTMDNKQISGPVWRCSGIPIIKEKNNFKSLIRFMDGTTVENRGTEGRIYDVFGTLSSN